MSLNLQLLGSNIKKERKQKKISQEDLAFDIGISRNYLSLIETGKREVTLTFLVGIANKLDCTIDSLLIGFQEHDNKECSKEFEELLCDCTPTEKRLILDLCKNAKQSLISYREEIVRSFEEDEY